MPGSAEIVMRDISLSKFVGKMFSEIRTQDLSVLTGNYDQARNSADYEWTGNAKVSTELPNYPSDSWSRIRDRRLKVPSFWSIKTINSIAGFFEVRGRSVLHEEVRPANFTVTVYNPATVLACAFGRFTVSSQRAMHFKFQLNWVVTLESCCLVPVPIINRAVLWEIIYRNISRVDNPYKMPRISFTQIVSKS